MRRAKALTYNKLKVMKALNLISSCLEQEHSLAVVSRQCASSRFHFHRVFKQETGETLSEAIRRTKTGACRQIPMLVPNLQYEPLSRFLRIFQLAKHGKKLSAALWPKPVGLSAAHAK
ncbi:AraC family transcriptional regulator [Chromobacterium haemolyticum]|nr:AraC family transcriptional regulator [Chromobacterium haemolyticum]